MPSAKFEPAYSEIVRPHIYALYHRPLGSASYSLRVTISIQLTDIRDQAARLELCIQEVPDSKTETCYPE